MVSCSVASRWRFLMDVRQAVRVAKDYIVDLLGDEGITNLGLEEIEHDDRAGVWRVTLGFSRPWNTVRNAITVLGGDAATKRAYRVVSVKDDGRVISVKRRDTESE
jgi:hypothetical protein